MSALPSLSARQAEIIDTMERFGFSVLSKTSLVMGDVFFFLNHSAMAFRSYVYPSAAKTGSTKHWEVMGQIKYSEQFILFVCLFVC